MSELDRPHIVGSKVLPPDPSLVTSLGLHHSLPTAIADLVDNSIDAGAHHVLIRLVQRGFRTVGLLVVDDGKGMDDADIDLAMTYAKKRDYTGDDLGHFGLGLKAASLSQAAKLLVWSRAYGSTAVGRLLDRGEVARCHAVSILDNEQSAARLDSVDAGFDTSTGTIVEWQKVYTFLSSDDPDDQSSWLEQSINAIRSHLGLVLHRILDAGNLTITIQQYDIESGMASAPRTVEPLDPVGYPRSGAPGYPRALEITLEGVEIPLTATAHIWPGGSQLPAFRLLGRPGREHQGLYFYRHDRLLQAGRWNGVTFEKRDYELGRLVIDIRDDVQTFVTINPEKSGLTLTAPFEAALRGSRFTDGGGGFADYLADLEGQSKQSRTRQRRPVILVEPGFGIPGSVVDVIDETVQISDEADPIEIRWRSLAPDQVFEVDIDEHRLNLNARMRETLVGHKSRDAEDAPVLKMLFHLLMSTTFESSWLGPAERQRLDAWNEILVAAVDAQRQEIDRRKGE